MKELRVARSGGAEPTMVPDNMIGQCVAHRQLDSLLCWRFWISYFGQAWMGLYKNMSIWVTSKCQISEEHKAFSGGYPMLQIYVGWFVKWQCEPALFRTHLGQVFSLVRWEILIQETYNSNIVNLVTIHYACMAHWVFTDELCDLVCQKAKSGIYWHHWSNRLFDAEGWR